MLPKGCAAADKAAALASNDPGAILSAQLAAVAAAQAAQLAAMKSRLDAVQPLLATLLAEPPASLTISGLSASNPLVWAGGIQTICFVVPPSANVNPKGLVLYVGDGSSGVFYPNSLGSASNPLPTDYQGCVTITVSTGVPLGAYTIMLQDTTTSNTFASVSFNTVKCTVAFASLSSTNTALALTITWSIPAAQASPLDTIKLMNSAGTVVYWFYTSNRLTTAPSATQAAAPTGSLVFKLLQAGSAPGGYTLQFFPGGGNVVGSTAPTWIPWVKLGY